MREMAGRRWRGQVPARLARELVPRVDELPEIERSQLLEQSVAANLADHRVGLQLACRPAGRQVGKGADARSRRSSSSAVRQPWPDQDQEVGLRPGQKHAQKAAQGRWRRRADEGHGKLAELRAASGQGGW